MLGLALAMMLIFSVFLKMATGATFSIVPFINKRALGSVAGIVGAGGNFGAVAAGFMIRSESLSWPTALFILGALVIVSAAVTTLLRFSEAEEEQARDEYERLVGVDVDVDTRLPDGTTA